MDPSQGRETDGWTAEEGSFFSTPLRGRSAMEWRNPIVPSNVPHHIRDRQFASVRTMKLNQGIEDARISGTHDLLVPWNDQKRTSRSPSPSKEIQQVVHLARTSTKNKRRDFASLIPILLPTNRSCFCLAGYGLFNMDTFDFKTMRRNA